MESMINYVHEKLKKLGAERLMDNAPVKLKGIGAVTGLMTNFQEKIKKTGADSMMQTKLKEMGAVSVSLMENLLEKLNKTTDQYEVVNYLQKKFRWESKNMTDKAKLKGIGAVTGLMTNFQEKIKKTGADSMMQMKLKGMEAVPVSQMKDVQEKVNKTTDQSEVVNHLKNKFSSEGDSRQDDESPRKEEHQDFQA
ncbi:Hypothetical predicted protein [Olea europaea subsp. europaea]|uniref:Uncharacterized protein n=1 Tax=Olea europaea subsp. europaea TaxID=158383 RepID=A0A8S0PIH4_OLEEU|nr:Hypothetical predicted protein [Olea europaea subsp. europaea]